MTRIYTLQEITLRTVLNEQSLELAREVSLLGSLSRISDNL